jgi:hypothetical protein
MDLISVVAHPDVIFQALLGAPAQHPVIRRSLLTTTDWITGKLDVEKRFGKFAWMGPYVVAEAMRDYYKVGNLSGVDDFYCKGVFLLRESDVSSQMPIGRLNGNACNYGFVDNNGTLYGYSRIKQSAVNFTDVAPCQIFLSELGKS